MVFKGKTVVAIVVAAMVVSSLGTSLVLGEANLLKPDSSILTMNLMPGKNSSSSLYEIKFKKALAMIRANYIRPINEQKLFDGAIQGMVQALGDPYSEYMDPEIAKQFKQSLESSFSGIGAEVTMKNNRLTIVSPFKGSPAQRAGLRPHDQVLSVDGSSLQKLSLVESVNKLRGPKGTKILLEILRPGVAEPIKVSVTRDNIPIQSIQTRMVQDKIGIINVDQFAEDTAKDFTTELNKMEKKGLQGLIIDVRGNPGGLLPAVLSMLDQLIPQKKPVLMIENKAGQREVFRSKLEKRKPYPIVVLIDKGSASASEILAATMQEAGKYKLVGETTFGKGTVQTAKDFTDGSNLKLTIAKWLTPTGKWIDQHGGSKGIKPDIQVSLPDYYRVVLPQITQPIKIGDKSIAIKNIEIMCEALGFSSGKIDGVYDKKTEEAIKSFQRSKNLSVTGVVDQKTVAHLAEGIIKLTKDPKNDKQLQVAIQAVKKQIK